MKKKLLFVQESLRLAGSEKSLITLLKNIDCNKYEIDLQLMSYGGELEKELPNYVNLLPELDIKKKLKKTLVEHIFSIRSLNDIKLFKERLRYSKKIRGKKKKHSEKAQLFWETIGKSISPSKKEYDAAIGFAQGFPTFYVMDKVIAQKKFCWINANMVLEGEHREYIKNYYQKFNNVVCITPQTKEIIQKQLPSLSNLIVLENIIDYQDILQASFAKDVRFDKNITNILTVGRLNKNSKGMDIALEASKALKQKGVRFHWYFLGEGPFEDEMKEYIVNNALQDRVTLFGTDANPYPYFKAANIYVQTSRHEGFGRAIAEARLLNIPIVSTRFDTVNQQIQHEKNGLISDLDGTSVAENIYRLMVDKVLYDKIKENLKNEPKQSLDSVKKFDELMQ
jgi:glycosyltransferase involved in cell wall biosynthesis